MTDALIMDRDRWSVPRMQNFAPHSKEEGTPTCAIHSALFFLLPSPIPHPLSLQTFLIRLARALATAVEELSSIQWT